MFSPYPGKGVESFHSSSTIVQMYIKAFKNKRLLWLVWLLFAQFSDHVNMPLDMLADQVIENSV